MLQEAVGLRVLHYVQSPVDYDRLLDAIRATAMNFRWIPVTDTPSALSKAETYQVMAKWLRPMALLALPALVVYAATLLGLLWFMMYRIQSVWNRPRSIPKKPVMQWSSTLVRWFLVLGIGIFMVLMVAQHSLQSFSGAVSTASDAFRHLHHWMTQCPSALFYDEPLVWDIQTSTRCFHSQMLPAPDKIQRIQRMLGIIPLLPLVLETVAVMVARFLKNHSIAKRLMLRMACFGGVFSLVQSIVIASVYAIMTLLLKDVCQLGHIVRYERQWKHVLVNPLYQLLSACDHPFHRPASCEALIKNMDLLEHAVCHSSPASLSLLSLAWYGTVCFVIPLLMLQIRIARSVSIV